MSVGADEPAATATNQSGTKPPSLIDVAAVARWLGMTPRHVRMLAREERIPYLRWSRRLMFDPQEINAWLDATRVPSRRPNHAPPENTLTPRPPR